MKKVTLESTVRVTLPPLIDTDPTPLSIDADVALLSVQTRVTDPRAIRVSGLAEKDPLGRRGAGGDTAAVVTVIVFELPLVPPELYARIR
jgi:hypothetical protein